MPESTPYPRQGLSIAQHSDTVPSALRHFHLIFVLRNYLASPIMLSQDPDHEVAHTSDDPRPNFALSLKFGYQEKPLAMYSNTGGRRACHGWRT